MRHQDDEVVTWGDLRRLLHKLDLRISDSFEAITTGDDAQAQFWNEHEEQIQRQRRRMNRIEKRLAELEVNSTE